MQLGRKLNQKLDKIQMYKELVLELAFISLHILFSSFQYKVFAVNQPELYRPTDNDDDDGGAANITAKEIEQEAKEVRKKNSLY